MCIRDSVNGVLSGASNSSEQIKARIDSLGFGGVGNTGSPSIFGLSDGPAGYYVGIDFGPGVIYIGNLNSDRGSPLVGDVVYGGKLINPIGYATVTVSPVPLPAALPLFGSAVLGLSLIHI